MIDEIKLKKMGRLSPADLVQPKMSEHARVAMNVALRRSGGYECGVAAVV